MKQQTYGHKPGIIVLIFAMMVFLLLSVSAENHWNNVITEIFVSTSSGETPPGGVSVSQWQEFRLNAKFELPNNQVKAGDKTIFTLPNELRFARDFDFPILAPDGITVVAQAHADAATKKLTITYTDYPEHHSNVTGEFYIYTYVDYTVVTQEQNVPITIIMEDGTVIHDGEVHYNGPAALPDPVLMHKNGWMMDNQQDHYHTIHINQTGQKISNAVLVDELQEPLPGVTYVRNTLTVKKGTWYADGSEWKLKDVTVISNPNVTWGTVDLGEGKTGETFRLELGNIAETEGYMVNYQVRINYEPSDGEAFHNKAKLSGDEIGTVEKIKTITVKIAGGSAQGYVFKIQIFKTDEDNTPLAGAKFDVIRVRNNLKVGDITTAANGMGELGNLLQDQYKLVETEAPDGCMPLTDPIFVEIDDFDENKIALKEIVNKRIEKISIPVTKTWVGPVAGPVTVQLKADGQDTGKTLTLSADNNWSGRFTDLPKYAADGHEIIYSVEEVNPPTGYTPSVASNPAGGFTITNTNTETVDVPVTKTWVGPVAGPVTVHLFADGVDTGKKITLKDEPGWGWVGGFNFLPKYNPDGSEIVYTVKEDAVPNYITAITPAPAGGFIITNTMPTGSWTPIATKALTGRVLADDEFEFELKENGNILQTVKNKADGSIPFAAINYTLADVGEHTYTITEKTGTLPGVTYDVLEVIYVVKVADMGDGTLEAAVTNAPNDTEFNNSYAADGRWVPTVTKALAGRVLTDDEFEFELKENGNILQTVKNKADGTIPFAAINYTLADVGEHTYTITEKTGTLPGVTYDVLEAIYAVNVTDKGDGTLEAAVTNAPNDTEFNNSYAADGRWVPTVTKALAGRVLTDDEFEFELKENGNILQTVKNKADGTIPFAAINYTLADVGEHTYTITEKTGTLSNITYDTMAVSFTVTVGDNGDGTLKATAIIPADTEFNNRYTPPEPPTPPTPSYDPISVPLSASKTLVNGSLKGGQFAFQLLSGDKKVIETVSNDASGQIHFTDRRFSKTGTFVYTIREVKGDDAKITYDSTVYRVIIKTTVVGGKLTAKVDYEKDGTPYGGDIKFVNRMEMPKTGDSHLLLPAYLIAMSLMMLGGAVLIRKKRSCSK